MGRAAPTGRCRGSHVLCAAWLVIAATSASAEYRLETSVWRYGISGYVDDGAARLDFREDLAVGRESDRRYALLLGWGGGWRPDLALSFSTLGGHGRNTATGSFSFGGIPIQEGSSELDTRARFRDDDATLRWPLRWRRFHIAPGLALKRLQGEVVITDRSNGNTSRQPFDEVFPLPHFHLAWRPARGLAFQAAVQGAEYQGSRAAEWQLAADLGLFYPLLIRVGWQEKNYDVSVPDYRLDARLRGVTTGLVFELP